MNDWEKEKAARNAANQIIAAAAATAMGLHAVDVSHSGFRLMYEPVAGDLRDNPGHGQLANRAMCYGKGYHVWTPDNNGGKWDISVLWPHAVADNYEMKPHRAENQITEKIGVSAKRGPEVLAKEIKRRLKDYPAAYDVQKERADRYDTRANAQQDTLKEFATLLGEEITDHNRDQFTSYQTGIHAVRVSSDGTVEIKTNYLTKDLAREVLTLIKAKASQDDDED